MNPIILAIGSKIIRGAIEREFKKAAWSRHLVEITDLKGHKRIGQPYFIFSTREKVRQLAIVYVSGYSDSGAKPWRMEKPKNQRIVFRENSAG